MEKKVFHYQNDFISYKIKRSSTALPLSKKFNVAPNKIRLVSEVKEARLRGCEVATVNSDSLESRGQASQKRGTQQKKRA